MRAIIFLCVGLLSASSIAGEDRLKLNETTIRGSRELPKVTYVVPWRDLLVTELPDWPVVRSVTDVPVPLDRDVFRRYVDYHGLLKDRKPEDNPVAK